MIVEKVLISQLWLGQKNNYYDRLEMGLTVHTVVGNHTAYYKNTNEVNAVDLLLREYDNVIVYSEYQEIFLYNLEYCFFRGLIKRMKRKHYADSKILKCKLSWVILELQGFRVTRCTCLETVQQEVMYSEVY